MYGLTLWNLLLTKINEELFGFNPFNVILNLIFFHHHLNGFIIVGKFPFQEVIKRYPKAPNVRFYVVFSDINFWSFRKDISSIHGHIS